MSRRSSANRVGGVNWVQKDASNSKFPPDPSKPRCCYGSCICHTTVSKPGSELLLWCAQPELWLLLFEVLRQASRLEECYHTMMDNTWNVTHLQSAVGAPEGSTGSKSSHWHSPYQAQHHTLDSSRSGTPAIWRKPCPRVTSGHRPLLWPHGSYPRAAYTSLVLSNVSWSRWLLVGLQLQRTSGILAVSHHKECFRQ